MHLTHFSKIDADFSCFVQPFNQYLKLRKQRLVHLWLAKRLHSTEDSFKSPQIDFSKVLRYQSRDNPVVLKENSEPFWCEDGTEIQDAEEYFPYSSGEASTD